jgi:hypothetical protein
MQHPLAEGLQLRASIALPLQQFQFSDLALDLPVTVGQLERGNFCRFSGIVSQLALSYPLKVGESSGWCFLRS